jgi:hypothetical protein
MASPGKYQPQKLIEMFRLAAALRNKMLEGGFTDNGGAIHSAERILNLLGLRLCFPGLNHINNLRNHPNALFSAKALAAHQAGEQVFIEHISPHRALTRLAIEQVVAGVSDEDFATFVQAHFKLALLTRAETDRLNKINRSKIAHDRLQAAGITVEPFNHVMPSAGGATPTVPPNNSFEADGFAAAQFQR